MWLQSFLRGLLAISKFLAFALLLYAALIMYQIGSYMISIIILFTVAMYLVLNRLDRAGVL
jgi:hypothetical protein